MDGGVSHVDSFDPKPKLTALDGQPFTTSTNPTANGNRQWLKSPWTFKQHGQSGIAGQRAVPAHCRLRRRAGRHPLDEGRPAAALDRRAAAAHGRQQRRPAEPRLVGHLRPGQREPRTCPASSCSASASCRAAAWRTSPADSCRPTIRPRCSRPTARRSTTSCRPTRTVRVQRRSSTCCGRQDDSFARSLGGDDAVESRDQAITRWPTRMQSLVPDVLDLAAKPRPRRSCTASTRTCRQNGCTASSACAPTTGRGGRPLRRDHLSAGGLERHLGPARQPEARARKERPRYRSGRGRADSAT